MTDPKSESTSTSDATSTGAVGGDATLPVTKPLLDPFGAPPPRNRDWTTKAERQLDTPND